MSWRSTRKSGTQQLQALCLSGLSPGVSAHTWHSTCPMTYWTRALKPWYVCKCRVRACVCMCMCVDARMCVCARGGVGGGGALFDIKPSCDFPHRQRAHKPLLPCPLQMTARMVEKVEFKAGTLSAQVTSENLFRGRSEPYICRLLPWSAIMCTCEYFQAVGGYCKHLRAALLQVSKLLPL